MSQDRYYDRDREYYKYRNDSGRMNDYDQRMSGRYDNRYDNGNAGLSTDESWNDWREMGNQYGNRYNYNQNQNEYRTDHWSRNRNGSYNNENRNRNRRQSYQPE